MSGPEELRDLRRTCQDAEDMVAAACAVRGEAADRAADAVSEAQRLARRLREQVDEEFENARRALSDWARDQCTAAEKLAAELVERARQEAAAIRADAIASATAEAEQVARTYAQRQTQSAAAEAAELRDEARHLILRSAGVIEDADTSGHEAMSTLAGLLDDLDEHCATTRSLVTEVETGAATAPAEVAGAPAAVRILVPKRDGPTSEAAPTTHGERANAAAAIRRAAPGAGALALPTVSLVHTPEAS